jgi:hypothetical protein
MRRAAFLLFTTVLASAPAAQAQLDPVPPPERWRNYDAAADGFSIRVPGVVQKRPWSDAGFPAVHYLTGSVEEALSITVVYYPPSIRGSATAPLIAQRFATLMLAGVSADKPTRNEAENCGGDAPGYVMEAPLPDELNYFARVCVTAETVYKVEAVVNREKLPAALPHVRAFLDSFRTRARLAPAAPLAPVEPPAPSAPAAAPPVEPPKPPDPPPKPAPPPLPSVTVPMPTAPK